MQTSKFFKFLLCGLMFLGASQAMAKTAHLTMHSQAGDYIGQGKDYDITYTPENSQLFYVNVGSYSGATAPNYLSFSFGYGDATPYANLDFATNRLGIPMQVGTYTDAQRAPFASASHPGLNVSFQHRGSNTLTGSFTVTDYIYSPTLGLQSFSVNFEQHSEGSTPALFGTFTYNDMPPAVPEPETYAMLLAGLGLIGVVARRRAKQA